MVGRGDRKKAKPTTTFLFSVLCVARCGPGPGVGGGGGERKRGNRIVEDESNGLHGSPNDTVYIFHAILTWSGPRPGGLTLRLRDSWGTEVRGWSSAIRGECMLPSHFFPAGGDSFELAPRRRRRRRRVFAPLMD
jgi:hypothetical protein